MKLNFFYLILICSLNAFSEKTYPDLWWKPVIDKNAPDWEILPQAASIKNNEVILSKRNELGVLSNFAATPFTLISSRYASLEGLWQSMKFPEGSQDIRFKKESSWPKLRQEVAALTAFEALKAGRQADEVMLKQNINWVSFEGYKMEYKGKDTDAYYDVIEAATRAKIDQNPEVKKVLIATGDLVLRPDHHEDKVKTKAWKYYDIYMKLRAELKTNPDKKLYTDDWFKIFIKKYNLPKSND